MTQINDGGNFKYNQIIRKSLRSAGLHTFVSFPNYI